MSTHDALVATCTVLTAVNTLLIWHIIRHKDSRIAALTAAILHTVGETKAADTVISPDKPIKLPELPTQRNRRVGLTPR